MLMPCSLLMGIPGWSRFVIGLTAGRFRPTGQFLGCFAGVEVLLRTARQSFWGASLLFREVDPHFDRTVSLFLATGLHFERVMLHFGRGRG